MKAQIEEKFLQWVVGFAEGDLEKILEIKQKIRENVENNA